MKVETTSYCRVIRGNNKDAIRRIKMWWFSHK